MLARFCASFNITPQDTAGALRPRPKKDSAVSPKIIAGIERVAEAIRWLIKFGNKCRRITRPGLAPIISAARTYSSSLNERNLLRTARAKPGQSNSPSIMEMMKKTDTGPQFEGTAADRANQSGNSGRDRRISMARLTTQSTVPPK